MPFDIDAPRLPTGRPLRWRAVWILSVLFVLGNLASIPLIQATQPARLEPPGLWILASVANFIIVAISLHLAGRIGLGSPLLEGLLAKGERLAWARTVFALSILIAVVASLTFLLLNRDLDPQRIPPLWTLLLASLDAGIQEEIFMRLFLVTLLAWMGGLIWRDEEGRPDSAVFWAAIIIAGLIFGWAHVDEQILSNGMYPSLVPVMTANLLFGIAFGWLYWKLGFEGAMLAHFLVDAVNFVIVVPACLSGNLLLGAAVVISLISAGIGSWRLLMR